MEKPYFAPAKPRYFAHRGLAQHKSLDENTLEAFAEALDHGATHLESDTQATSDGHAVLFHDSDLVRVAGDSRAISSLSLNELQEIRLLQGGRIPTLQEALINFPTAFFNLDIKSPAAISPTIDAIEQTNAHHRVLISSFSNPIRKKALQGFSKSIATSASASVAAAAWFSHTFLFGAGFAQIVQGIDALQVPTKMGLVNFAKPNLIRRAQKHKVEVHFWTINEPSEAEKLLAMGADGIVTDRLDLIKLSNP